MEDKRKHLEIIHLAKIKQNNVPSSRMALYGLSHTPSPNVASSNDKIHSDEHIFRDLKIL
jgi:hypothetical protein